MTVAAAVLCIVMLFAFSCAASFGAGYLMAIIRRSAGLEDA